MTREETTVWNKIADYAQKAHGYSVVNLEPNGDVGYTVKLNQLGASTKSRQITIFSDVFSSIITSDDLPQTVKRNIDEAVR
jgi:hypothetical protein